MRAFDGVGPERRPAALAARPVGGSGRLSALYKSGTVVGGVGVLADGFYTHRQEHRRQRRRCRRGDRATRRRSASPRRSIVAAIASPSTARRCASAMSTSTQLRSNPASAPGVRHASRRSVGALMPVPGYFDGVIRAGTVVRSAGVGHSSRRRRRLSRAAMHSCSSMPRTRCAIRRAPAPTARDRRRRADAERSAHGAAVSARRRESRSRADPPTGRFAGARDDLGRRHARRDSRHRPHARCAGVRHRRVVAEGAHRGVHVIEHGGAHSSRRCRMRSI